MSLLLSRHAILPAIFAAALAVPAAAQDAHHPPSDRTKPPATEPTQPRAGQPGMPGGMMTENMMQMMRQMMSGMQDRGAMHRRGMMGLGGMGMMMPMQGPMAETAIEHVEGHVAFIKAELRITMAQGKVWDDFATAMRANAKQLDDLRTELTKAGATHASPVDRAAQQEKILTSRLEMVRRTKPALTALYAALADDQKNAFAHLISPRMSMR